MGGWSLCTLFLFLLLRGRQRRWTNQCGGLVDAGDSHLGGTIGSVGMGPAGLLFLLLYLSWSYRVECVRRLHCCGPALTDACSLLGGFHVFLVVSLPLDTPLLALFVGLVRLSSGFVLQMLTGSTPFKGSCADDTFANILSSPLKWPDSVAVSSDCKAVVKKLLRREPEKRLGAENGASEIKAARVVYGVTCLIRNEVPPIIPIARDELADTGAPAMADDGDNDAALDDRGDQDNPFSDFSLKREALHRHY